MKRIDPITTSKDRLVLANIAALCLLGVGHCLAQAAPMYATATRPISDKTFWDLFQQGGFMMWVMLGVSMFALSLIIESAVKLRQRVIAPPELFDQLKALLAQANYHEAWRVANVRPCPFSRVVAAGLEALGGGRESVNEALEEHALKEAMILKTRVNYLSVIGVVSPMLGLIGTVVGMIEAFEVIGQMQTHPTVLAEAIGKVLVATAFGLFIAVPAFFSYYFFRNRAQAMMVLLQDRVTRLMKNLPYGELQGVRIGQELEAELAPAAAIAMDAAIGVTAAPVMAVVAVHCPSCACSITPGASPCPLCGAELRWN